MSPSVLVVTSQSCHSAGYLAFASAALTYVSTAASRVCGMYVMLYTVQMTLASLNRSTEAHVETGGFVGTMKGTT